jgi:anaerobic selenocysteine-containing dehydrogenase
MSKATDDKAASRRDFLKLAGAAPVAAGAAVIGTEAAAATETPAKAGIQDTDHIRTYYATARF